MATRSFSRKAVGVCAVAATCLVLVRGAHGDWREQAKLSPLDVQYNNRFGDSVSIDGPRAIVGAMGNDYKGNETGAAYIFHRNGEQWTEAAMLLADDADGGERFGDSVSIGGAYAVVGAYNSSPNALYHAGAAYVFHWDGSHWTQDVKLTASSSNVGGEFGRSVSIDGGCMVVGAVGAQSAYVFEQGATGWSQVAELRPSDPGNGKFFGLSVCLSGDRAIVGASGHDALGTSGAAYVFRREGAGWIQEAKLVSSDLAMEDIFGTAVSISGDYAIVGAPQDDDDGDRSGSAYIFQRSGGVWTQTAKLRASDAAELDIFGASVSISGDSAVIGALYDASAYVFQREGTEWTQVAKFVGSRASGYDGFGQAVGISDGYAIVGAYWSSDDIQQGGSAYIFVPEPATLAVLALGGLALLRRRRGPRRAPAGGRWTPQTAFRREPAGLPDDDGPPAEEPPPNEWLAAGDGGIPL